MAQLILDISMSLDGFVAGPNPGLEHPLGEGGEQLHEWAFPPGPFGRPMGNPAARRTPTRRSSRNSAVEWAPP
jgi:hypothetical protein